MLKLVVITGALVTWVTGCKSKEVSPVHTGSGSATGGSASADATGSDATDVHASGPEGSDPDPDFVGVFARFVEPRADRPVEVEFARFTVVKARFDPKNIVGGTAEITLDTNSLILDGIFITPLTLDMISPSSDSDEHRMQTPGHLDPAVYGTVTIDVDNVKRKAGRVYSADAEVKFHGFAKKYPITFTVLWTMDDAIKIKAEKSFSRLDFKIGPDSADPKVAPVQPGLTIKTLLTLRAT